MGQMWDDTEAEVDSPQCTMTDGIMTDGTMTDGRWQNVAQIVHWTTLTDRCSAKANIMLQQAPDACTQSLHQLAPVGAQ